MNTVDIRDTEATQSLYWTVAIPVTVVVLALAFVYGYRGDEIGDWIHDRIRLWNAARASRPDEVAGARKPLIPMTDGVGFNGAATDAGAKEVWGTVLRNSVRRRNRRTDREAMRRSTFQSDTLP